MGTSLPMIIGAVPDSLIYIKEKDIYVKGTTWRKKDAEKLLRFLRKNKTKKK